ncbi:SH3 domain-binding protein 2-like isoform X2 [Dreissena polymorpha]|uniref:SH3 domain-binding protein 2-like isoform X2 n=1 Tax=Dreissena polymorpha TaxID=45954 RepID=UPI0022651275|nr:SH3 domain-binding protein 2-like isoform X2 [Dreissena polymorpha]
MEDIPRIPSAQELLQVEKFTKFGFLRKQGWWERLIKFILWRHKFVVLSRGCLYVYSNELAGRPQQSINLNQYKRCERHQQVEGRMQYMFKLVPEMTQTDHVVYFACVTDDNRMEWMLAVKNEMLRAHKFSDEQIARHKQGFGDEGDYAYIEKEVSMDTIPTPDPKDNAPLPADTNDDEYSEIEDPNELRGPYKSSLASTLPSNTSPKVDGLHEPNAIKTLPPKKPIKKVVISRSCFMYEGTSREEVEKLLLAMPEGTFLVRRSRNDNKEVVSVNIENSLKEFKIHQHDDGLTLDNSQKFSTVEDLIQYYLEHNLPNKTVRLGRPFAQSTQPGASYVNTK